MVRDLSTDLGIISLVFLREGWQCLRLPDMDRNVPLLLTVKLVKRCFGQDLFPQCQSRPTGLLDYE